MKKLLKYLCLMILADENKNEEVEIVSDIFNKLTNGKKFSKSQIDKTTNSLKKNKKTINDYLKEIRPYLI